MSFTNTLTEKCLFVFACCVLRDSFFPDRTLEFVVDIVPRTVYLHYTPIDIYYINNIHISSEIKGKAGLNLMGISFTVSEDIL